MGETYTNLGPTVSWSAGAVLALTSIIVAVWNHFRKKKPLALKPLVEPVLFGVLLAVFGRWIPVTIIFLLMLFYYGAKILFAKSWPGKRQHKFVVAGAFFLMGVLSMFLLLGTFRETIVLSPDSVAWHTSYSEGKAPRQGLSINAIGPDQPWYLNSYFSWFVTSGHDRGPYIEGFDLYKGPDGIIRGDELGVRLAKWAGTKPEFETRKHLAAKIESYKSHPTKGS